MEKTRIILQKSLKNEVVESMFHTDLMNIFKELGVEYPKECESLSKHILLDLKNTTNLENFEERTHLMFQNYKVLGKDLLKVVFEKNDRYNEALFFEIKELVNKLNLNLEDKKVLDFGCGDGKITNMIASYLNESSVHGFDIINSMPEKTDNKAFFNINTQGFLGKSISSGNFDCIFVVNVLSHCSDLDGILERIKNLTNRIVIVETVPFWTKVKEIEINKERTFLNDYFYNRIFSKQTNIPFVGNYKAPHGWDVLFAQKGFEVKSSLSKSFDFNHLLLSEEKRPLVKTKHYIGVYEKASDAITATCK
jgi:2-polyprenyl-3-methyl-5-hydroxy-6-metoxy-1,4-benzoquinol methylase